MSCSLFGHPPAMLLQLWSPNSRLWLSMLEYEKARAPYMGVLSLVMRGNHAIPNAAVSLTYLLSHDHECVCAWQRFGGHRRRCFYVGVVVL